MNADHTRAVPWLAAQIEQGQPLPNATDRRWAGFGSPSAIEQIDLIIRAQDVVTASESFAQFPATSQISDLFPAPYPDNDPGHVGPADTAEATVWARVGVPVGRSTVYFSVRVDAPWTMHAFNVDALLENAIDDLVSGYAAFGGARAGIPRILQILVY